jgi:hypothetical protein
MFLAARGNFWASAQSTVMSRRCNYTSTLCASVKTFFTARSPSLSTRLFGSRVDLAGSAYAFSECGFSNELVGKVEANIGQVVGGVLYMYDILRRFREK